MNKMEIKPLEITIREIYDGYTDDIDDPEEGVTGYGGLLDIRPKYQREFIYDDKRRAAVIDTVTKGFPLNTMYWAKNTDNTYEVLDGQQRTISICQYVRGDFTVNTEGYAKAFHNLTPEQKDQILDYKLTVYVCEGDEAERLKWFEIINIAGVVLTRQELRNVNYTGPWLSDAKRLFSKRECRAKKIAEKYMAGSPIRQEYLETALGWLSLGDIDKYMSKHQRSDSADELWEYFEKVIKWVESTFPNYRKEMKGVEWGVLYNKYGAAVLNTDELEALIISLMKDEDVTKKSGIYNYVLTGDEHNLSIRAFTDNQKREAYERQEGYCTVCGEHFEMEEMEADHITPWIDGGKTIAENCQMLCRDDNRRKSDI